MIRHCWSYVSLVEKLKINNIVFGLDVFEMGYHEGLWACVYKEIEVKMVNGNAKSFDVGHNILFNFCN